MITLPDIALVLCGGGGRGAYQIGVWQALRELGFDKYITGVSGTSVGALNAALFACGDIDLSERLWSDLNQNDITNAPEAAGRAIGSVINILANNRKITLKDIEKTVKSGVFSREGLVFLIEKNNVAKCVSGGKMPCFACCYNETLYKAEYFDMRAMTPKKITEILAASTAIPAIFPAQKIGKYSYRDGGISDNTPVKPLYDIGYRKFIISYLGSEPADLSAFSDAKFLELFPSDDILLGKPYNPVIKTGTLDFNGENAQERIELGRKETIPQLELNSSFFLPTLLENKS